MLLPGDTQRLLVLLLWAVLDDHHLGPRLLLQLFDGLTSLAWVVRRRGGQLVNGKMMEG